jgi:D-hydroxyproline dehydrogenase subunit beta
VSVSSSPDVVIVGAGVVGAACAYLLAASGARVQVCERSFVAAGSSGACEGNVLSWDKETERELPLALRSAQLWQDFAERLPDFEYDRKGSVVVAETPEELHAATQRATLLAGFGVHGIPLDQKALRAEEPYVADDLPGGVLYPGDAQLEPRLATAALAHAAVAHGATLTTGVSVERLLRAPDGRVTGIQTSRGRISAGAVVVAAGVWTPSLLETAGLHVPVTPRKGQVVVLERSPVRFRRKLSEAGYVAAVEADDAALQVAMVVESTPSGTALLGSSRQRVGFDRTVDVAVAGAVAARAARFFPILRRSRALRVYAGLRPLTPDHVPIVGPFAEAPNLCVATGHEGAGIGLAPATAELVAAWHAGAPSPLPLDWFSPDRFAPAALAVS